MIPFSSLEGTMEVSIYTKLSTAELFRPELGPVMFEKQNKKKPHLQRAHHGR